MPALMVLGATLVLRKGEDVEIKIGDEVHETIRAMIVPGSGLVKEQAEKEGLDKIFLEAGFEWREPGCSMCLAMNNDRLKPGELVGVAHDIDVGRAVCLVVGE